MAGTLPDYYAILGVKETATASQIRDAYKRAALKTHPDRVPSNSPERGSRTRQFQLVNDAYYTLSDSGRRRQYDAQRGINQRRGAPADPFEEADEEFPQHQGAPNQGAYSWAWDFFTKKPDANNNERRRAEDEQFQDAFEEMMREEGMAENETGEPTGKIWGMLGAVSGGALGFIVANVSGMVAGAVAGNRLGAVRDAKGKSVYDVFQELPPEDRTRLLGQLAAKVFSHVAGV